MLRIQSLKKIESYLIKKFTDPNQNEKDFILNCIYIIKINIIFISNIDFNNYKFFVDYIF